VDTGKQWGVSQGACIQKHCKQHFIFVTDMQEVPTKARLLGQFLQLASLCEQIKVEDVKLPELKFRSILDKVDILRPTHLYAKLLNLDRQAQPPAPGEMREDLKEIQYSLEGLKLCVFVQLNETNVALVSNIQYNATQLRDNYDIFLRRHNQLSTDRFWPDDWVPESSSNPYVITSIC